MRQIISFIFFIMFCSPLFAQVVNVNGIVLDDETNQPIIGANVAFSRIDTDVLRGSNTDQEGRYRIRNLEPGTYAVQVSYIGYISHTDTLKIDSGESILYNIDLLRDSEMLGDVVISAGNEAAKLIGGHQRISAAELDRVVTPAGSGDLVNYLQALPGVVSAGDRGGQLFVRGGTPSENMALMDGQLIYQPFHIVGFFSAFPEEIIANADFYAGGFQSKYGGRISSVLDVSMKQGNYENFSGMVSLSPYLFETRMEGPLSKDNSSWIASFRTSQIDRTSEVISGIRQPIHFDSQYFKYSHKSDSGTRCSATLLRTYDRGQLDFEFGDSFKWTNFLLGGKCTYISPDPEIYVDFNTGISFFGNSMGGESGLDLNSRITRTRTDLDITQFVGDTRFDYGFFMHMKWLGYDVEDLLVGREDQTELLLGTGGYLDFNIDLGERVYINPGARISFYTSEYDPSLEPRLKFGWYPFGNDGSELNVSFGVYRQSISGITDLRDAGTSFVAWMPSPNGKRLSSIHFLTGWRQEISKYFQYSVEGYHKKLRNIPVTTWSNVAKFTTDLDFADGSVYGIDLRAEFGSPVIYGFVGYGYSTTEYRSSQDSFNTWFGTPIQEYNPSHDRKHQVNAMVTVELNNITTTLRWQFGSGTPFTRQMGADGVYRYGSELPNIRTQYGIPRVLLDKPFDGRTPAFHRLDLSVSREFIYRSVSLTTDIGVINSYDQRNLFYYDVFTQRRIDQMPFFPYLSLKVEV